MVTFSSSNQPPPKHTHTVIFIILSFITFFPVNTPSCTFEVPFGERTPITPSHQVCKHLLCFTLHILLPLQR